MQPKAIPFSPPDITQAEIDEVVAALKSGWITTGPRTKKFEIEIAQYCGAERAVCLNSATAGLELALRLFDIGEGDEVITTPYTYAATANVILHTGATPVFVDTKPGEFNIDPAAIERAITPRTKAVMSVDIAGWPVDYREIRAVLERKKNLYQPTRDTLQTKLDRVLFISDAAHAFGSTYEGKKVGTHADLTVFSFHAVKNLTTAEGGAVMFNSLPGLPAEDIYKRLMLLALHGQSKDALAKAQAGSWFYTIDVPGYKFNMTDIAAAIGLAQLERYDREIMPARKRVSAVYDRHFANHPRILPPPFTAPNKQGCDHLMPIRLKNGNEVLRDQVIQKMAQRKISLNVHFIPVVMHPAYRRLGYDIAHYPNCFAMYASEISLPIYSTLAPADAEYICRELDNCLSEL